MPPNGDRDDRAEDAEGGDRRRSDPWRLTHLDPDHAGAPAAICTVSPGQPEGQDVVGPDSVSVIVPRIAPLRVVRPSTAIQSVRSSRPSSSKGWIDAI
jgi:hypothetical protein